MFPDILRKSQIGQSGRLILHITILTKQIHTTERQKSNRNKSWNDFKKRKNRRNFGNFRKIKKRENHSKQLIL